MSRRRPLGLLCTLLCSLVLTACVDSVPDAQQARSYSEGVSAESGSIRVVNALVVAADDSDDGAVMMTVVNRGNQDDRLTGITSNAGEVTFSSPQELPANRRVAFGAAGGDDADTSATATVRGLEVGPGEEVMLKLTFEQAEPLTLRTVVVPAAGEYASITPAPEPTPTPDVEESASPAESPADGTSPTPEAS